MKLSGVLDIVNSIVFFQLIFFSVYLFVKGQKIPSTNILKIHLICQLMIFTTYPAWRNDDYFLRFFFLLSQPALFLLAPTFYLYVRSRLYKNFNLSWKSLIHSVPAAVYLLFIIPILVNGENFHDRIMNLAHDFYFPVKIQFLFYNSYTLYLIYKYRYGLKFVTSASEQQKLNWLLLITYGILFTSLLDFILFLMPPFTDRGLGFLVFFVFINIFFFKAIIQPDQFLGLDEQKLLPVKISEEKGTRIFNQIEAIIDGKQLYLDPDLSLKNVAQAVRTSERTVSQVIKLEAKTNFSDYINKKRINYAKDVLKSTTRSEKNVLEVLYEAGFNSKSVFNTQFMKHTGMSPTEYRKINSER